MVSNYTKVNGNGIDNITTKTYGNSESVYMEPSSDKSFTLGS